MHFHLGQMVQRAMLVNIFLFGSICIVMAAEPERPVRIVALGDSLTAGFGLKPGEGFPEQLAKLLKARGRNVEIANAGVSGDTTAAGLARLDWAVTEGTDAVIVELGANDALGGRSVVDARRNLDTIIARLKARGFPILLAGMRVPRNLGNDYANQFDAIFLDLAEKHQILLYPFFLTGVALDPKLNLGDGIHPTAEGVRIIAERIAPRVEELMAQVEALRRKPAAEKSPRG